MEPEFKIGDKIYLDRKDDSHGCTSINGNDSYIVITQVSEKKDYIHYSVFNLDGVYTGTCSGHMHYWQKIKKTNNMSLLSLVKNATRKEPEKSFVKAGVMTDSLELTSEGKDLFLYFMLEKHKDEFKKEVVDAVLAEQEKEEGK